MHGLGKGIAITAIAGAVAWMATHGVNMTPVMGIGMAGFIAVAIWF